MLISIFMNGMTLFMEYKGIDVRKFPQITYFVKIRGLNVLNFIIFGSIDLSMSIDYQFSEIKIEFQIPSHT